MYVAAGEIRTRGAEIGHEQRVADEDMVADAIADIGRRVAGRVEHLDGEIADVEGFPVGKEAIEIAAIGFQVRGIEDRTEDFLHVLDVLADADPRAGLRLHKG